MFLGHFSLICMTVPTESTMFGGIQRPLWLATWNSCKNVTIVEDSYFAKAQHPIIRNANSSWERKMWNIWRTIQNTKWQFKPWYNETIKSLQFCKLSRQVNESPEEWMGKLRIAATEGHYKEIDRQLIEQFIHHLNDSDMSIEIIKRLTKIDENNNVTREQVLAWARRVEAQSVILENWNKTKDFKKIFTKNIVKRQSGMQPWEQIRIIMRQRFRYCGSIHLSRQCLANGKMCATGRKKQQLQRGLERWQKQNVAQHQPTRRTKPRWRQHG